MAKILKQTNPGGWVCLETRYLLSVASKNIKTQAIYFLSKMTEIFEIGLSGPGGIFTKLLRKCWKTVARDERNINNFCQFLWKSLKIHKYGSSPPIWLKSGSLFLWWLWPHPWSKKFVDLASFISGLIILNLEHRRWKKMKKWKV